MTEIIVVYSGLLLLSIIGTVWVIAAKKASNSKTTEKKTLKSNVQVDEEGETSEKNESSESRIRQQLITLLGSSFRYSDDLIDEMKNEKVLCISRKIGNFSPDFALNIPVHGAGIVAVAGGRNLKPMNIENYFITNRQLQYDLAYLGPDNNLQVIAFLNFGPSETSSELTHAEKFHHAETVKEKRPTP